MKKIIIFLLFAICAFCEDFRLSFLIGDVFLKQKDKKEYVKASLNMVIKEGDIIRTDKDSKAEIIRNDDVVKIEPNTTFKVKVLTKNKDVFSIFFGKVWSRIKRLKEKETSIETPTAVMGLRGTIFSVDVFGKKTIVDLLDGELDVFSEGKRFILKSGERFFCDRDLPIEKRIEKRPLSSDEKDKFKDIFKLEKLPQTLPQGQLPQVELTPEVKLAPEVKKGAFDSFQAPEEIDDLKTEIKNIKNELVNERLSVLSVKENDFQAGRTMRDKWGNLTRVEQHLYRPRNNEIRFVNINKRETSNNASEFSYGMVDATFNKELPDDISKWQEWIKDQIDEAKNPDIHPEKLETILSNGTPQDANADRMKWESKWANNKLTEPTFWIDKGGDNKIEYTKYSKDWKELSKNEPKNECSKEETFSIYDPSNENKKGELKMSIYLINNDGKQMTDDDLKNINLFDFFENTGCEMRFESPEHESPEQKLLNKPIDVLFTADIVLGCIRKFMGSIIGSLE